jgi:hypothetical protein
MIGLMFFGAIGLWGITAIALSLWAAKLAGAKWRWLAALVLMPLVFFAPVADEIVAYPQFYSYCNFRLADGVTEQFAFGKKVQYLESNFKKRLVSGVLVEIRSSQLNDSSSGQTLLVGEAIKPLKTMLSFSIDGGTEIITAFLNTCPSDRNLDLYKKNHDYVTKTLKIEFVKK